MHCTACQERSERRPRLDCDYFEHYLKTRRFRFKRRVKAVPAHYGTYVLTTQYGVMVGPFAKLEPLHKRLGGELRKLDIIRD